MDENRIKEVFSDDAFIKNLLEKENAADVQTALKEKDLSFSLDEINEIRDKLIEISDQKSELSLEQLQDVAGGSATAAVIGVVGLVLAAGGGLLIGGAPVVHTLTRGRW